MGFNKGEWSEIYTFLYLLENPDIKIVNNELICIDEQIFKIIEILNDTVKYKIDINKIKKITVNGEVKEYLLSNLSSLLHSPSFFYFYLYQFSISLYHLRFL